jgi:hypothetical protein
MKVQHVPRDESQSASAGVARGAFLAAATKINPRQT